MAYANNNYYQPNRTQRPRGKWWIPQNEEQRKLFDSAKADVLCFLTINLKEGVKARYAYSRMAEEMDSQINYKAMGFAHFAEFLYHIDDILSLKEGPDGQEYLFLKNSSAAGNEDISHISALVKGQSTASKRKGLKVRQSNSRFIPSDRLLGINCERGMSASAASSSGNRVIPLPPKRISGPRGRQRQSRTRNTSTFRSTSSSIPTLKPLNAPAMALVNSTAKSIPSRSNVPTLRPISSQQQHQTRSVTMSNRPKMRSIPPRFSTLSQPSTTPKLRPLSEIQKLHPPISSFGSNIQENRKEQEYKNDVIPKPSRPSVPQLKPLAQLQLRTIPNNNNFNKVEDSSSHTNMEEDEKDTYNGDEEDASVSSGDESEEFEFNDEQNENSCPIEQDEIDGDLRVGFRISSSSAPSNQNFTAMTQDEKDVLGRMKDQTSSSTSSNCQDNGTKSAFKFSSLKKELEVLSSTNISHMPSSNNKIYKKLTVSQMSLSGLSSSFKATLLGSDQWGFLFIKRKHPLIDNSFKIFHAQRQIFYSNQENQQKNQMDPSMIENGVYVVAFVNSSGLFIRARVAENCDGHDFCIVFDIDDCEYHFIPKKNIYHIDVTFTLRHPQAIMVVLRNTENYVLTAQFEELVSPGFEHISQDIIVTNITSPDPLFRAPIVSIMTQDGKDLYETLKSYSPRLASNNTTILTSLTTEQKEILKELELKGHVVSTISL